MPLGILCDSVRATWIFTSASSIFRLPGIYRIYMCLQNFLEIVKQPIKRAVWKTTEMIFCRSSRNQMLASSKKTTRQQHEDIKLNTNQSNSAFKIPDILLNIIPKWIIKIFLAILDSVLVIVPINTILQKCLNIICSEFRALIYSNIGIDVVYKPGGLQNNGNTCYMNSIIQMLASSNKTIRQLKNKKINSNISNPALEVLIDLLQDVNNGKSDVAANTDKLKLLIKNINWEKPLQQDSYDFLCALINGVQANWVEQESMPLKITIAYKFQGVQIQNRLQTNLGLSLGLCGNYAVYPGVQLKDLINDYFSPTNIDEDINKTVQTCFYEEVPEILLLHIQANKWDQHSGKMIKPKYYIQYCENIELNMIVAQDLHEENFKSELVKYKLCAFIHHTGDISGGHHVSYRKHNENWFLVDDIQVTERKLKCDVCPYVLLYEKSDNGVRGN